MNHEPECQLYRHGEVPCTCDDVRAAYQRGREDERKEMQYDLILGAAREPEDTLRPAQNTLWDGEQVDQDRLKAIKQQRDTERKS